MSYTIIGFGKIGRALAHAFARRNIDVTVVSRRPAKLATDPIVDGGHRVVFLSSDEEDAIAPVADLAKQLGFAPVKLGKLNEGGALVHARGRTWGQLVFQDLFKKEQ